MSNQSFATHLRYVPTYHYGTFGALLVVLVWSLFKLITDFSIDRLMMLVLVVAVAFATYYARAFALRAQDRVIRLEEQMRLLRLLPDQLQARIDELSVAQLIALRFASDAELPDLVRRVLDERMANTNDIKRAIKTWRPDHVRV